MYVDRRLLRTKFLPLFCSGVGRKAGITLGKNGILFADGNKLIDDHTLVALTIMIAESKPDEKEMMISVIMNCICG